MNRPLLLLLIAGLSSISIIGAALGKELPNFVIIFADDQGYQDAGCYGSPDISTPNLDKMAEDGMQFTDFYVAASVCTPSRGSLLTSKYPARLGSANRVLFPHHPNSGLDPEEVTLAKQLKKEGYATACIGKWHLGHTDKYLPTNHGFDSYYGIPYSNDMWLAPELVKSENMILRAGITLAKMESMAGPKKTDENRNHVPLMRDNEIIEFPADQTTLTKRYTEEAIKFITANKEKPFFLYLAHTMPHIPLFASPEFKGKSKAGLYGDTIEEIDWAVGQINSRLEALGLAENTLVVFTSDNGPWLSVGKSGGRAGPLRNGKGTNFEGGQRVPCIMKMPGVIEAGSLNQELCSTLDLFPTMSAMADIPVEHAIDGRDITDLLVTEGANTPHEYFLYFNGDTPVAIRSGDWKLIVEKPGADYWLKGGGYTIPEGGFSPELYNLAEDIGETRNRIKELPEKASKLLDLLNRAKRSL